MLIKPAKDNVLNFKQKVSQTVKGLTNPQAVVAKLRPIILGWGNYYRHSVAKRVYNTLDDYIWQCTYNWAISRHSTSTSRKSIAIKYFQRDKGGWNFVGKDTNSRLVKLSDIPIRRFIKVRKDTRVYDVNAIDYWKEREYLKARASIHGSKSVNVLFNKQKGKCSHCRQEITDKEIRDGKTHQHHLKPRSEGGEWKSGNLRLLHADCHDSLHSMFSRNEMAGYIDKGIDYLRLMKSAK
jgi:RNA-directed DNA polymerase